jgi:hypothetical protein
MNSTQACLSCSTTAEQCRQTNCATPCALQNGDGGGNAPPPDLEASPNCAALALCCPRLSVTDQPACQATAQLNDDAACANLLTQKCAPL